MKVKLFFLLLSLFVFSSPAFSQEAAPATEAAQPPQQQQISADMAFAMIAGNAEKGNANAMLTLGAFYEQGIGAPRNFTKAMEWYKKAAETGLAEGHYNLGVCYEIGMGNSGDIKKAVEHFEKAADLGLVQAMQKLSTMCFTGNGVEQSEAGGLFWLTKAGDAGAGDANNTLGVIYLQGLLNQKKDEKKAFEYFKKAADAGNLESIKNLGVLYKDGLGVKQDAGQALKWYLIAQKGGYQAGDMDVILTELKGKLKPAQIKTIETEATKWIEDFQKKNQKPGGA